jgi:hypothetical protein
VVQFLNCDEGYCDPEGNLITYFRFGGGDLTEFDIGSVWYISGSTNFEGCATVVENTGLGTLYSAMGVTFIEITSCAHPLCPRTPKRGAQLARCSDGLIIYGTVDEDTAFPGAAYVLSGQCYEFIEFSGPGGEYFGSPVYDDCQSCQVTPTPTPSKTPQQTPTNTPTPTPTPQPCPNNQYCLDTILPELSGYSGTYTANGYYNGKLQYEGDGILTGYIFYNGNEWCLSNILYGECLLEGASPCLSNCPDISANHFSVGSCPPEPPIPPDCSLFDFEAYFDCNYIPDPQPIPCDDLDFNLSVIPVTPSPTPTSTFCVIALDFSVINNEPSSTPTPTPTPSPFGSSTIVGNVTFVVFDEMFSCVSVKVLQDCESGSELYTSDMLVFNSLNITIGTSFSAVVNGDNKCLTYVRDDLNYSSNTNIQEINGLYSDCSDCSIN